MAMMIFPIDELMDEDRCYAMRLQTLHPNGLHGPEGHRLPESATPHERDRAPVLDCRCKECGHDFNAFTGTRLKGMRFPCSKIVLIFRGFAQGIPTLHLAKELKIARRNRMRIRHRVQAQGLERFSPLWSPRSDRRSGRNVPKRRGEGDSTPRSK